MTVQDYNQLKKIKLIDNSFGTLSRGYNIVKTGFSFHEKIQTYKEEDIPMDIIWGQLVNPIDINNMIIIFTSHWIGANRFFRKNGIEVLTDHCTYPVEIKHFLEKKGLRYKNKVSLIKDYIQNNVSMLIVQDGIVYELERSADPTDRFVWDDLLEHPFKPTPADKVTIEGKEIIMSGFFKTRFIKK